MWGIATVVMSLQNVLDQFQRVYFRYLPLLNVNCHIDLPWRILPEQYQGLGMTYYALVSLSLKLSFLQCDWGFDIAHLKAMMMGYEPFMIEVGLYGNTMDYNYNSHSMLVMDNTWFKNVWESVSYFNVSLNFDLDYQLKPIRWGDSSLMSKFLHYKEFGIADVISLTL
jgi:hypothetical protein